MAGTVMPIASKNWYIMVLIFIIGHIIFTVSALNLMMESGGAEHRLVNHLMNRYSRYVRPVRNESSVVSIEYHMKLSRILKIDEINQILTTTWWLEQRWFDEFLTWDPTEFENVSSINLPINHIWFPDTVLYNSADVDREPGTGVMMTYAIVSHTGLVYWPAPAIFRSSCKMDITYFPFDYQFCTMKFGPWVYDGNAVRMKKVSDGDYSAVTPNGQWALLDMYVEEHLEMYGCCPAPFSDITYYIQLRRKSLFYMLNLLFPTIFMGLLSLISFYLPPESGEKVGLNITLMLSLVFYLLLGATLLPPTSLSVTYLGKLFACLLVIMSLETATSVIIVRLYLHAPNKLPPSWSRYLILDKLARLMCLTDRHHEYDSTENIGNDYEDDETNDVDTWADNNITHEAIGKCLLKQLQFEPSKHNSENFNDIIDEETYVIIGSSIMRIDRYLKLIGQKLKTRDKLSSVQQLWVDLCIIIDRVLLVCFVLVLNTSAIIILYRMLNDSDSTVSH